MANPYRDKLGRFASAAGASLYSGGANTAAQLGASLSASYTASRTVRNLGGGSGAQIGTAVASALVASRVADAVSSKAGVALHRAGQKRIARTGSNAKK